MGVAQFRTADSLLTPRWTGLAYLCRLPARAQPCLSGRKTFRQDEDAGSAGGAAQRSAAKHENDYDDQEQEPDRASTNIEGIGKKWRG
jgi:hypothetical protein